MKNVSDDREILAVLHSTIQVETTGPPTTSVFLSAGITFGPNIDFAPFVAYLARTAIKLLVFRTSRIITRGIKMNIIKPMFTIWF